MFQNQRSGSAKLQSWGNKAAEEQKRTVYSTKRTN
jgi:hypothetical protein